MSEAGHVVDFKKAKFQAQAKSKGSKLVQEAWLSGLKALNRSIEPGIPPKKENSTTKSPCFRER